MAVVADAHYSNRAGGGELLHTLCVMFHFLIIY